MLTDEKEKGSHSPFPSKELPGGLRAICVASIEQWWPLVTITQTTSKSGKKNGRTVERKKVIKRTFTSFIGHNDRCCTRS